MRACGLAASREPTSGVGVGSGASSVVVGGVVVVAAAPGTEVRTTSAAMEAGVTKAKGPRRMRRGVGGRLEIDQ